MSRRSTIMPANLDHLTAVIDHKVAKLVAQGKTHDEALELLKNDPEMMLLVMNMMRGALKEIDAANGVADQDQENRH